MSDYQAIRPFIDDLRVNGFSIGLVEELRLIELLLQLHVGTSPIASDRLCGMLAPILCCTLEQQSRLRTRFDAHFGAVHRPATSQSNDWSTEESPEKAVAPTSESSLRTALRSISVQNRWRIATRGMVTLSTALVLLFVVPQIVVQPVSDNKRVQPPGGIFGPITERFAKRDKAPAKMRDPRREKRSPPAPKPAAAQIAWHEISRTLGPFALFALTAPFLLAGMWTVAPGRREYAYVSRREIRARPKFVELLVATGRGSPVDEHATAQKLQPLRRPRVGLSTDIDVDACIPRMLENGGVFDPVFRHRRIAPEYLVLLDRRSAGDHVAQCGQALVQAMQAANVHVDVYWFDRDIRRLFNSLEAPSLSLEDVAGRHGDHRLLLVASGERLLNWTTGAVEPWTLILRQFERRVMLTPAPRTLWGYRERTIFEALDIAILPLSSESIVAMVDIFAGDAPSKASAPVAAPPDDHQLELADLLEERPLRWLGGSPPPPAEREELLVALKGALSEAEWRWLCACAVYPQLIWSITLFVGEAAVGQKNATVPSFDQLVTLARLPWFRAGIMPNWLRECLSGLMSDTEYHILLSRFSQLFQTVLQPQRGGTRLVIGDHRNVPTMLDTTVKDEVLVDFLSRPPRTRTGVALTPEIASRFGQSKQVKGWLRSIRSSRSLDEIRSDANLLSNMLADIEPTLAVVYPHSRSAGIDADYRIVKNLTNEYGKMFDANGLALYLPAGSPTAYLVNEWTTAMHKRRRVLALRLGMANLILTMISVAVFFVEFNQVEGNISLNVLIAVGWIAIPFGVLSVFLVLPLTRILKTFPIVKPFGATPRHLAHVFEIER